MSAPPFMPLYVGDYLGDTSHLTTTEHGAYLLLLMTMWRSAGKLPNDPQKLARFCRCTRGQWERMSHTVLSFFDITDDTISHGRLSAELTKYTYAVERQRVKSSDGGRAKWLKNKKPPPACGIPQAMPNVCQPEPEVLVSLLRSENQNPRDDARPLALGGQDESSREVAEGGSLKDRKALADEVVASLKVRRKGAA